MLGHDVVTDHAAGFTDVNLPGPVARVGKLVFGVTPFGELLGQVGGDACIGQEEIEKTFLITDVLGDDAVTSWPSWNLVSSKAWPPGALTRSNRL